MEINFSGKTALVTGGAGGVGSAVVEKLLACGARVLALDNNEDALAALKAKFPSVETMCVDLLDWEATRTAGEQCPHIDLLVNVAAIFIAEEVGKIQEESFNRIFGVNVKAIINLSQVIAERMKAANRGGAIVNISSEITTKIYETMLVYASSKAALDLITKAMALELGPYKIRVNAVNPTAINTESYSKTGKEKLGEQLLNRIPLGRIAEPEDVANAVAYLLSDKADMISGVLMLIDGGSSAH